MNFLRILYGIAEKEYNNLGILFMKVFPSVSYAGDPSVSMGINIPTFFGPPVHTPSASQAPCGGTALGCKGQRIFIPVKPNRK